MKFAIVGGTHGNEPVGIKVMQEMQKEDSKKFLNSFEAFLGNPKAYEIGKRYVDSDLNRSFGVNGESKGYERIRSSEMTKMIKGKFDFILDLHTTTSNMGITLILTSLDQNSVNAACYLKSIMPEIKIIISVRAGENCPYTSSLAPSAITVEVGPAANNVLKTQLILDTYKIVTESLNFKFDQTFDYSKIECFKTIGFKSYPDSGDWMIHPNIDGHDFIALNDQDPLYINLKNEVIPYEGDTVYPLFINEAAYQENNTSMEYAKVTTLDKVLSSLSTKV